MVKTDQNTVTYELFEEAKQYVEDITAIDTEVLSLVKQLDGLSNDMGKIEGMHTIAITNAVNENGKPVFSNQMLRDTELNTRLASDENYQDLKFQSDTVGDEIKHMRIRRDHLHNLYSLTKAYLRSRGND